MAERFDAIVIGAGQAGPSLCGRMDAEGLRTVLIERAELGGTCVNRGCIPSKAMIASARVAWLARHGADYGVAIGPVEPGVGAVVRRKDAIVEGMRARLARWIGGMSNVSLVRGHARFTGPHEVEVHGRTLEAPRIFINVGARPLVPDIPGVDRVPFFTSTEMLALDFTPAHLIVVGASYVGLEFTQMYARFGSRVTVVEKDDRIVPKEDADVSETLRGILEGEGIEVRTASRCIALERSAAGVAVGLQCDQGAPIAEGSHVLLAVGRAPNTPDLGLEKAGVRTDERGYIVVDDELRTSVPGVWALGEVNGRGAFTHTAYNDYEIVAANLFDGDTRRVSDRVLAYALFTDPPLGRAGPGEAEVRASGRPALVGTLPMARVGRARAAGETLGFIKVFVDAASRRVLGAAILGLAGDEAIHVLLDAIYAKTPCEQIARAVHIHPTVSEYIPTVLGNLQPLA
jgi:pyruvate/2-oxoglutarate dehydrogenase complex dihydrolipoamide dehydrogenase (E3) component